MAVQANPLIKTLALSPRRRRRALPPARRPMAAVRCSAAARSYNITLLPGDGIGPEVVAVAEDVLSLAGALEGVEFRFQEKLMGGAALDAYGVPLPDETLTAAKASDAVLLGAIGGYKWDNNEKHLKPETGLLQIRAGLGIYFGIPRGFGTNDKGEDTGFNTEVYSVSEVARKRRGKLCSVDKANVLEAPMLWRKWVTSLASVFPDIELSHMYVDNAAMQLIRNPKQFDTIVTNNIFGDILSDEASMLTGSIGMLPSASVGESGPGLFEPIHGSAPDIAGQCCHAIAVWPWRRKCCKERVEAAVTETLNNGFRTGDIYSPGTTLVGCKRMGEEVLKTVESQSAVAVNSSKRDNLVSDTTVFDSEADGSSSAIEKRQRDMADINCNLAATSARLTTLERASPPAATVQPNNVKYKRQTHSSL
ncbi:hypothetical protein ABZP36_020286 [Zizania latifolia]